MNYTIVTLEEAAKRFALDSFSLFDNYQKDKKALVKIAENDAVLTELHLDILPNDNTVAYIFTENLTVLGNIWNEETDFGMAFLALKNVKAHNIAVGGQDIYIKGNLDVEKLLCGSYNHGTMTVKGHVKARYILNDDYTFLFEGKVSGIVLNDIKSGYYKINNWKESLDNYIFKKPSNIEYWDVLNPSVYDAYNDCFDFKELIKLLNNGDNLFMSNEEKLKQLDVNSTFLIELFDALKLDKDVHEFGFGLKNIDLSFNFHKNEPNYYLEIKLKNESFEYELKNTVFTTHLLTINSLPKILNFNTDFKGYYRAITILKKTEAYIKEFISKRDAILIATENIIPNIFPNEFPIIYAQLKMLYENPMAYYEENKGFFDGLKIDFLDWSFQKQAVLHILKELNIALVINGKEYISYALNDIKQWFNERHYDIDTDWKARGLYLKRRLEYFSKDVLIVNTVCEEKKIPLSILDFSLWLNDRFIVFIPINNAYKSELIKWLNELDIK